MSGEHIGNCGKVGGGGGICWKPIGNLMGTQWSDFGAFYFFPPRKFTLLPKKLPHHQSAGSSSVAPTSYWQDLLLDFTYLLTYLLTGNCLPCYRQLNPRWRLRKLNGLFYLPRSHGKLSLEFITCHVVSRTFHVISKSSHWTSLLAT
jgi:hypothetical protein